MYITPDTGHATTQPRPPVRDERREAAAGIASAPARTVGHRPAPRAAARPAPVIDIPMVLGWLRRGLWLIIAAAIVCALAGFAFGTLAKPRYTASVDLLVDPGNLQVLADDVLPQAAQSDSQLLAVESKLRVLTAGTTLADVVSALHLDKDPEFVQPGGGLFGDGQAGDPATAALRSLDLRVKASREERSYMVTLSVWTDDAKKSVTIANAVVAAFKDELAKSNADAVGQAASALDDRLAGLKAAVSAAEDKVEAFKRSHNLQENAGLLTSSVAMAQINTQVLDATKSLNDAQAHYQQLVAGGADAAGAETTDSTTMSALRAQYSTLKQQADALAMTLGPRHPTRLSMESQLAAAKAQIAQETGRVVQAAKTQVDQARAALDALKGQAAAASSTVFDDADAQVQLNQLERDATAQATIYQTFLARTQSVVQQQQIDTTNVRVISPPILPDARSYPPRTVLLFVGGAFLGLLLGAGIAAGLGFLRLLRPERRTA